MSKRHDKFLQPADGIVFVDRASGRGNEQRHGSFSGEPDTRWCTEDGTPDRRMMLLADFSFCDPDEHAWDAPARSVVDGASIPRALWTLVGSPYTGDYRRASIVHDVACVRAGEDKKLRRRADRMFFHACRAGGCSTWEAIVLYLGVRIGAAAKDAPAWHAALSTESAGPRIRRSEDERRLERDFQELADRVLADGDTDDSQELERRVDEAFRELVTWKVAKPRRR